MTTIALLPGNEGDAIPPNTFEFGVASADAPQIIINVWQSSNVFNLPDGRYYYAIRRKADKIIVKDGFQLLSGISLDQALAAKDFILNNATSKLFPIQNNGQTLINIGLDELRKQVYVNGLRQRYGIDYVIELPFIRWISPVFNLTTRHTIDLSFF